MKVLLSEALCDEQGIRFDFKSKQKKSRRHKDRQANNKKYEKRNANKKFLSFMFYIFLSTDSKTLLFFF